MAKESLLSTSDNPFNPFTDFEDWYRYDTDKGYHTCSLLNRVTALSDDLSDADYEVEMSNSIDGIIKDVPLGVDGVTYIKVQREIDL